MPYLVYRLLAARPLVEPIGAIEDDALVGADILVSMNHAGGDDEQHGVVDSDDFGLMREVGRRFRPVVPEIHLEVGRTQETKTIGLIDMLMRAASDAGLRHGNVRHDRMKLGRQFIVAKQLTKPAARVVELLERLPDDPTVEAGMKGHRDLQCQQITRNKTRVTRPR